MLIDQLLNAIEIQKLSPNEERGKRAAHH